MAGRAYELPRYLFIGPKGGDDMIRVGLFAGIHGDEPEGVHALIQFLTVLERSRSWPPAIACLCIRSAIRPGMKTGHAMRAAGRT